MSRSARGWGDAPEDVVVEIAHFLEVEDIFSLGKVCRSYHEASHVRSVWKMKLMDLLGRRVPLATSNANTEEVDLDKMPLIELQKLLLRTSSLEQNLASPIPKPRRLVTFQIRAVEQVPILRLLHDRWLLSASGTRLEFRALRDQTRANDFFISWTPSQVQNFFIPEDFGSELLILVAFEPRVLAETKELCIVKVHLARRDFTVMWRKRFWDFQFETIPSRLTVAVLPNGIVAMPSASPEMTTRIRLFDWKGNRTGHLILPEVFQPKCTAQGESLYICGVTFDGAPRHTLIRVYRYDAPELLRAFDHGTPKASSILDIPGGPFMTYQVSTSVSRLSTSMSEADPLIPLHHVHLVSTRLITNTRENSTIVFRKVDIDSFPDGSMQASDSISHPLALNGARRMLDVMFQSKTCLRRPLFVRQSLGDSPRDKLILCNALEDGTVSSIVIDMPQYSTELSFSGSPYDFDERCGVIAWAPKGRSEIWVAYL